MYYDEDLFPRFFEQAVAHLSENGKLIMIFSNLAEINHSTDKHPIKEELIHGNRYQKDLLLSKRMSVGSTKTKRNLSHREGEIVELWVLSKV
jgi:hypothetical protein